MSCFFCDSFYHLSQNCDVFVNDDIRHLIAKTKRRCCLCLNALDANHNQRVCERKKRCYQCFSHDHHTFFCSNIGTRFFVPNIDEDLFLRFIHLFDPVGQCALINISPWTVNMAELKQLRIIKEVNLTHEFNNRSAGVHYVVVDKLVYSASYFINSIIPGTITNRAKTVSLQNVKISGADFFLLVTSYTETLSCDNVQCVLQLNSVDFISKPPDIRAKTLVLRDVYFSAAHFFMLLSSHTQTLVCNSVKFKPEINFLDILSKAPDIKIIDCNLHYCNINVPKTWPESLFNVESLSKTKLLKFSVLFLNFNIDALTTFMKKTQTDVIIRVCGVHYPPLSCTYCMGLFGNYFYQQKPDNQATTIVPRLTIKYQSKTYLLYLK